MSVPSLATQFLSTLMPNQRKSISRDDINTLAFTYGGEVYTRMHNVSPPREVMLVAFADGSALAFRERDAGSGIFAPDKNDIKLKLAIESAQDTFATTGDTSHKYKNSDGADVVVAASPPKSPSKATKSSKKKGGSFRRKRCHRSRSTKYRRGRGRLSRNRK
jgi:hypothetical protein